MIWMPFSQLRIHASLLQGLRDLGFHQPTPIQSDAIPPALEGRDLLACAMTGSGKTVAFLLPILHHLVGKPRGTTRALVLTPTRELARDMLRDPIIINRERRSQPAAGITQAVYPVPQHHKTDLLLALLRGGEIDDALVFTRTKHRADRLAKQLGRERVRVQRIHGNRSQAQRTEALAGFKSGKYQVLVATDIAARGIDVTALGHVINYDVPAQPDDYVHRVGRTARAELTGSAFTLVSPDEEGSVRGIERAIRKALPPGTLPDFDYHGVPAPRSDAGPPRHDRFRPQRSSWGKRPRRRSR